MKQIFHVDIAGSNFYFRKRSDAVAMVSLLGKVVGFEGRISLDSVDQDLPEYEKVPWQVQNHYNYSIETWREAGEKGRAEILAKVVEYQAIPYDERKGVDFSDWLKADELQLSFHS